MTASRRHNNSTFRKEYSKDHPLAGGKGKYKQERAKGLVPIGGYGEYASLDSQRTNTSSVPEFPVERISTVRSEIVNEPMKQFLKYKADLDDLLKAALEEEASAEEDRTQALTQIYDKDEHEVIRRVINEDRERSSLRLKRMVEENDQKLKDALRYLLLEV
jgi:hypothetical protein